MTNLPRFIGFSYASCEFLALILEPFSSILFLFSGCYVFGAYLANFKHPFRGTSVSKANQTNPLEANRFKFALDEQINAKFYMHRERWRYFTFLFLIRGSYTMK